MKKKRSTRSPKKKSIYPLCNGDVVQLKGKEQRIGTLDAMIWDPQTDRLYFNLKLSGGKIIKITDKQIARKL